MNDKFHFLTRVKDENFWKDVRENPKYKIFTDELIEYYNLNCRKEIEELPYSMFKIYWENGSRLEYEEIYFSRRRRLNVTALLSVIYPENKEYFTKLQDALWAVCNEFSWGLPAHIGFSKEAPKYGAVHADSYNNIDLFAAETGFALSEIKFLLKDRLDKIVCERIEENLERRIIKPFLENDFFWETIRENWAAVCGAGVGCTFIYERPDLFPKVKERINNAMKSFLSSYKNEGVCEEGVMYWEYGFGFFVAYAELLREVTNGTENLFELPIVKKIAEYSNMIFLGDKYPITFGDTTLTTKPVSMGLMEFLRHYFGDSISVFDLENYGFGERNARWQRHLRSIVYFDTECEYKSQADNVVYFKPESGLFIKKSELYDIAVTAAYNDMPHNHNDLGSFILRYKNKRIFDDFGAGEYNKDYFDNERYSYFVCRSGGHNVPLINGREQPYGKEYKAQMEYNDCLTVDLTSAYNDENLKKYIRIFEFKENGLIINDRFDLKGYAKERFVTKIKPKECDGILEIAEAKILYDKEKWNVSISKDGFSNHEKGEFIPVYVIDFENRCETDAFKLCVEF